MIRGTTAYLEFILPFDVSEIEKMYISIVQAGGYSTEKTEKDCELNVNQVLLILEQEETLSFVVGAPTEVQVRIKTTAGDCLASDIFTINIEKILKDGEI